MRQPPGESFLIPFDVAKAYEERFFPALFADWARPTLGHPRRVERSGARCRLRHRHRGANAAEIVGVAGCVVGVDINPAMLAVARHVRPDIEWRQGDARALPFTDGSCDQMVCQMALMFFADRRGAAAETARVTRPGGTVTVMRPAELMEQPAWGPFVDAAARHAGADAVRLLGTYWAAGDPGEHAELFRVAGLEDVGVTTGVRLATFPSLDAMITTEVESTTPASRLDPADYERIRTDERAALARFGAPDGRALLPLTGRLGHRPEGAS